MRILFLGLNYAPEQISTGVYSAGLCEELASRGHQVHVIAGKPYYPEWRVRDEYRGGRTRQSETNGIKVIYVAHYVPANPTGMRRILHHASFALSALPPMLARVRAIEPDIVFTVAPSLVAAPVAWLAAKITGTKSWLHVQDFEVEAAFATELLDGSGFAARLARGFERKVIRAFDRASSISPEMCTKLVEMGRTPDTVYEFRNWANLSQIAPLETPSPFRDEWDIKTPHVALYSGNIANKQGLEILVEAARLLAERNDLTFVICGQGPNKKRLERLAVGLDNIRFCDLQPLERLKDLMGLATLHLLPQKADAADLVLPSKLTNMLASGRPVVATAHPGTGLAREIETCGIAVPPEDAEALATAIVRIIDEPELHAKLSANARERAIAAWDKKAIIDALELKLHELTTKECSKLKHCCKQDSQELASSISNNGKPSQ